MVGLLMSDFAEQVAAASAAHPPVRVAISIVEFLDARLTADERMCSRTPGGAFKVVALDGGSGLDEEAVQQYYHRFQPEWMVLDLAAKRRMLEWWKIWNMPEKAPTPDLPSHPRNDEWARATRHAISIVLHQMAAVYRDHVDYDPAWALMSSDD